MEEGEKVNNQRAMRAEKARDGGATATAMDGATATQHDGRCDGNRRRDRDAPSTAATAMEGARAMEGAMAMDGARVTAMATVAMDDVARRR